MECGEASGILHKEIRIAKENIMQQSMKSQKNALDWKARKKETLISISTGLRILPKSIPFLVFLFMSNLRPKPLNAYARQAVP